MIFDMFFEDKLCFCYLIGVMMGNVMMVLGLVLVVEMGIMLMYEYIFFDGFKLWKCFCYLDEKVIGEQDVSIEIIGELWMNLYMNCDNVLFDDGDLVLLEFGKFQVFGGVMVIDVMNIGIGCVLEKFVWFVCMFGFKIVMGSGFYFEYIYFEWLKVMDVDDVIEFFVNDVGGGVEQLLIMVGIIGEVGISKDFMVEEMKLLCVFVCVFCLIGVLLMIYFLGWECLVYKVFDVVEEEGVDFFYMVFCYMNLSYEDFDYQVSFVRCGVFLEYDMIGMDYYYVDQDVQLFFDEQNVRVLIWLIEFGYIEWLLFFQDVFLKIMFICYGGFGYGYIFKYFLVWLCWYGVEQVVIDCILIDNL